MSRFILINILIGADDDVTLIDFAHARSAPIILDATKLETHIAAVLTQADRANPREAEEERRLIIQDRWGLGATLRDGMLGTTCKMLREAFKVEFPTVSELWSGNLVASVMR